MTHHQKLIKALRMAGKRGIHSFDIRHIGGLQAPVRIKELKEEKGFNIISISEKKGNARGCRYILISEDRGEEYSSSSATRKEAVSPHPLPSYQMRLVV